MRKKDYDEAEAAYKKAIELNAELVARRTTASPTSTTRRRSSTWPPKRARRRRSCSAAAPGGGGAGGAASASAVFNQGVILWNAGKIPEAQKPFEQAVEADPKMADAHYWLGMAMVNQGKLPEAVKSFEEYLKLDATGQYADRRRACWRRSRSSSGFGVQGS